MYVARADGGLVELAQVRVKSFYEFFRARACAEPVANKHWTDNSSWMGRTFGSTEVASDPSKL